MKEKLTKIERAENQQDKPIKPIKMKKYYEKTCTRAVFAIILHSRFGNNDTEENARGH
jgi:hypothetical protein